MGCYLVTGASGFVGGALARDLLRGHHRVITVLRDGEAPEGCEVVRGDITDRAVLYRALTRFRLDGVFHLAAHAKVEECQRDPLGAWESNVRGTYLLLEMTSGLGFPVVVATSDHAYGDCPQGDEPSQEDDLFEPAGGVYDTSKACADMVAMCYGRSGHDVRVVRCGNIYGPGDRDESRIVPSLMADLLAGRDMTVRSDGTPIREYLHVSDAVAGYRAVMERGLPGRAYNVAGGDAMSVLSLAETVRTIWSSYVASQAGEIRVLGQRTGDIRQLRLDTTRARTELGWSAKMPIDRGIRDTMAWWLRKRRG